MGAMTFFEVGKGKTAKEAFHTAREQSLCENGQGGYTGTLAEKDTFEVISVPDGEDPEKFANKLIDADDPRVSDKWGPAGCVKIKDGEYLFFGWASS